MSQYIKLLRIEQWVKNFFVFVPMFFSGNLLHAQHLLETVFAFLVFSLVASSIYILNDYNDIHSDRQHPEKRRRPLASGKISPKVALFVFTILICSVALLLIFGGLWFHRDFAGFALVIGVYFVMNLAYTFKLKHIAIVDVFIIALGFVLRVFAGGFATGIPISQWAALLTFVLALVLAVGKRRGELINAKISGETRRALDGYNVQFADVALSISVTLAVVCYLMFILTREVQQEFGGKVFYTVLFVVFALMRYLQQTLVYSRTESPTKTIYRDRYIQITLLFWVLSFMILIYGKQIFHH